MALAACVEVPFAAPDGAAAGDPAAPNPDWWLQVQENIRREEYRPTWQERDADGNAFPEPTPQFSNRSQGLRAYFGRDGVWYEPRARNGNWRVALRLEGLTRGGGNPNFAADETGDEPSHPPPSAASPGSPAHGLPSAAAPKAQKPRIDGHRIVYDRPWGREWYANREEGIEQAFEIAQRPDGTGTLRIVLAAEAPGHSVATPERVVFSTPERDVLEYGKLVVTDASGRPVPSRMEYVEEKLALAIEDDAAEYPLMVDPLSTAPHWTAESNQAIASFGYSVSSAGDVNGDGYGDVIVGAYQFDNGQADEGRAYVYHGSGTGLSTTANWTAESDLAGAWFGQSVSTAGDVNGDGYSDVIIGAPYLDNGQADEGRAYVYLGAGSGLASTPVWTAESDQANARFALSVSTAGDVNGDGYGDVIVGAVLFDNGQTDEGRVYVYHGSATGVTSVANWTAESNVEYVSFGNSVSTAGDVNGDGYGDVIVGAYTFSSGQLNEGRASVFHGSATGLSSVPNWA
ncbi:MAG: FG-GAP repeat protein, partial [Planctomycetes bacterium]|nr:FG-GAP repeat protein [Planctomycetota bacterium]